MQGLLVKYGEIALRGKNRYIFENKLIEAIASAVSAGHRSFKRIATISEGGTYSLPCGNCRQLLSEFSPGIEVLCARASDGRYVSYSLTALLPMPLSATEV